MHNRLVETLHGLHSYGPLGNGCIAWEFDRPALRMRSGDQLCRGGLPELAGLSDSWSGRRLPAASGFPAVAPGALHGSAAAGVREPGAVAFVRRLPDAVRSHLSRWEWSNSPPKTRCR